MLMNLLLFLSLLAYTQAFGKHQFPLTTHRGEQLANEFQLLEPASIRFIDRVSASGDYSVSASPLELDNDQTLTISYKSTNPDKYDFVAVYSASADINEVVPLKYGWCDDSSEYLSTGLGSLQFNMTNVRTDISVYMFTGGTKYPVYATKFDENIQFKNVNEPLKARVVPTGDYDVFKLLWSSATSTKPVVKFGFTSGDYSNVVDATTKTISRDQVCGAPANTTGWFDLGLIHEALLTGMLDAPSRNLYYVFGDAETNNWSEERVFHLPPPNGRSSEPTRVILYDDLGRGSDDQAYTWNEYGRPAYSTIKSVNQLVIDGKVDAVYHGGDISYATGYLSVWDYFLDMLEPVAGSVLYLTTVGNHESDWYDSASLYSNSDSGGECGVLTTELIPLPAPATTDKPWWSYNVGMIHFVGISTEHNYDVGSEQYIWLENDLKSVDRSVYPWIVFGGHRAMYINSNYGDGETSDLAVMDRMIEQLEPLLFKYKVNVGFYGHNHVVQRHSAVYNRTVVQKSVEVNDESGNFLYRLQENPQATVHFIIGTGGASFTKNYVTPYPEFNEDVFYEWGYTHLTAYNATHLEWKWIKSDNNEVLDLVYITQEDPATTGPWTF